MVNIYFLDSSALIKRYVVEIGSPWIKTLTDSQTGNSLLLVRITWVEVLSAFARRQREGGITAAEVAALIAKFRSEFNSRYRVIEVDLPLVERAGELIVQYPLRAYDAVQLAAALRVQSVLTSMPETQLIFFRRTTDCSILLSRQGWRRIILIIIRNQAVGSQECKSS